MTKTFCDCCGEETNDLVRLSFQRLNTDPAMQSSANLDPRDLCKKCLADFLSAGDDLSAKAVEVKQQA